MDSVMLISIAIPFLIALCLMFSAITSKKDLPIAKGTNPKKGSAEREGDKSKQLEITPYSKEFFHGKNKSSDYWANYLSKGGGFGI